MSYCKRDGKDRSIFLTKEDADQPAVVSGLVEEDEAYGIVKPDGSINWECPCLGGMPFGPCGDEFKQAFSCFHYSTAEEKGMDCIPQFRAMQECFQNHPEEYGKYSEDDEEEESKEQDGGSGNEKGGNREQERDSKKEEISKEEMRSNSESDSAGTQQSSNVSSTEPPMTASLPH